MKVLYSILFAIVILLPSQRSYSQTDSTHVGFILASLFVERWKTDQVYFEKKINELGGKVTFIDCYDDPQNQIDAARRLVKQGVDAIVIVPVDGELASEVVEIGHDANIPVIAYGRLILNSKVDYFISFSAFEIGQIVAQYSLDNIQSGAIVSINGPMDDNNSKLMRDGIHSKIDPASNARDIKLIDLQATSWTQLNAYFLMDDYFAEDANPIPSAILCANDELARGVTSYLEERDLLGKVIVTGQDAELDICKMIADGQMSASVYMQIPKLASTAAASVLEIVEKGKVETNNSIHNGSMYVPTIFLKPVLVTKSTLHETVIADGFHKEEDIFGE